MNGGSRTRGSMTRAANDQTGEKIVESCISLRQEMLVNPVDVQVEDDTAEEQDDLCDEEAAERDELDDESPLLIPPDFPFLHESGRWKGRPHSGYIENTMALLEHFGIEVKDNEMTRDTEILGTGTLTENTALVKVRNLGRRYGLAIDAVQDHLTELADQNRYHPVRDWIESRPWDGTSRLCAFINTQLIITRGVTNCLCFLSYM